MTEKEWVALIVEFLRHRLPAGCSAKIGYRLPYSLEIVRYSEEAPVTQPIAYQTDILITEEDGSGWLPRIVIEAKIGNVTTHDAITYSQKAANHKAVHPYLRYGIVLGAWGDYALPGRLFRHGAHFDFMFAFTGTEPSKAEGVRFVSLIETEIDASRTLERITFDSRKRDREKYNLFQRRLILE